MQPRLTILSDEEIRKLHVRALDILEAEGQPEYILYGGPALLSGFVAYPVARALRRR